MWLNEKKNKIIMKKTDNCSSTSVTDDLVVHSELSPATKHIQIIMLNCKKNWNLHKNSQAVKKGATHAKKTAWKSCEIQGGGPEVAVMVG